MVSVLVHILGTHNLDVAEDIVQETLLKALQVWPYHTIPDNPEAWLMQVAKRKAIDYIRKEKYSQRFSPELQRFLSSEWSLNTTVERAFAEHEVEDDLLRMMFTCCHPSLSIEAQLALTLNVLCGLSVNEIAAAF